MKALFKTIESLVSLPDASKENLVSLISKKTLKKKDTLAKAGEIPENIYILKSGIARSFYSDEKGKEYIRSFFTPIRAVGALGALILNKPSKFSYDCLSDCKIYSINFKSFKELAKKDPAIANLYAKVLEVVFLELESKVYNLSVLNATQRYKKLKKRIPEIENLVPLYHIAAYLNITAVQLSRIRKEMYSK
ncbi:Crp/Fnr family transcriptional regulator [Polaribacter batillariae]|uniref:Crp/Fnr family transcriptional regulator n=1 Tax=Polaribacter batillariae TaxID=2808900 RepID=A0ABX7SSI7_9FLAO|nr:Crp/Fnr family transcriptional regulator [Polaribacter batillariae]QTD37209.1 Crp/Fnr family transcriptional regulator [Polaribacter batillariae]